MWPGGMGVITYFTYILKIRGLSGQGGVGLDRVEGGGFFFARDMGGRVVVAGEDRVVIGPG